MSAMLELALRQQRGQFFSRFAQRSESLPDFNDRDALGL